MQREKAVGFFYSWSPDRKLDAYFTKVADAFAVLGFDLEIILATDFLTERGHQSVNPHIDRKKLLAYVQSLKPAFVFSINNAGMIYELQSQIECPVIKWFVDDLPHLFLHDGIESLDHVLTGKETAFSYASTLQADLKKRFPLPSGEIHFSHHATDPASIRLQMASSKYGISFVATCLDTEPFVQYLKQLRSVGQFAAINGLLKLLEELELNYSVEFEDRLRSLDLTEALAYLGITWLDLKRVYSDVLTTQHRAQAILALVDLDFHLFGNDRWLESVSVAGGVARRFHFDRKVASFADLADVYQSSKISINVPNVQNANGLAARIFDIMGSNSLLVCDEAASHDLKRVFGVDCPVPVYRDLTELRALCAKFLDDEPLRIDLVRKCQALITEDFRFHIVISRMLMLGGVSLPSVEMAETGTIIYLHRFKFITPMGIFSKFLRFTFRRAVATLKSRLREALRKG